MILWPPSVIYVFHSDSKILWKSTTYVCYVQRSVFDPFPESTQHFYNYNCLRRNTSDPFAITILLILSTDVGRLLDNQLFCCFFEENILMWWLIMITWTWSIKQMIPLPIPHASLKSILTTIFPAHTLQKSWWFKKKTPRLYKSYFTLSF